ncbi:MAG: hypothetical protein OER04_10605 [Cyclobacteriaceae bacterium]|nr:hypothetical protein [Cyclobacteriaceae bacterium]
METLHRNTKISLGYVAGYLIMGGLLFLWVPQTALKIFQSSGQYDDIMIRVVGLMMLGLAIVVIQVIRLNLIQEFYPTTLMLRMFLTAGMIGLYFYSGDIMFLIISGIIVLGMIMTVYFYLRDERSQGPA